MAAVAHAVFGALAGATLAVFPLASPARAADQSLPVNLQQNVLTATVFTQFADTIEAPAMKAALLETAGTILRHDIAHRDAVDDYARLHGVPGKLDYLYRPVSWQSLHERGDEAGLQAFVDMLTGEIRDFSVLAGHVDCPTGGHRTICITGLSVFDVAGIGKDDIQFEAPGYEKLVPAFLADIATRAPKRFRISIWADIDIDVPKGEILEADPFGRFELERYRVYDDVVETGVTSDILPAAVRDRPLLYESFPIASNEWALHDTYKTIEAKVAENVVFPRYFASSGQQFGWSLHQIARLFDGTAFVSDKPIAQDALAIDQALLREANRRFKRYDRVSVDFDFRMIGIHKADLGRYVAETGRDSYYDAMVVFDVGFDGIAIRNEKSSESLYIQPR